MTDGSTPTERTRRFELYVRSLAPGSASPAQEHVVSELERLSEAGAVEEYRVHVWGDALALDSRSARTETGQRVHRRVRRFEEWADREDVAIPGAFERREVHTMVGETHDVLTLPVLLLAEYRGGELVAVSPRTEDGETVSVRDHVEHVAESTTADRPEAVEATV